MEQNCSKTVNSYDQYERYDRLPTLLKRYSFEEKMRIANVNSSDGIMFVRNIREKKSIVFPWCIETFVMLSMEAKEYDNGDFRGKNNRKAMKMFNAIWKATSEILDRTCGRFEFTDTFLSVTLLNQFKVQEIDGILKYRYWYVFGQNFDGVPLKDIFEEKLGTFYEEYLLFGEILEAIFLAKSDHGYISIPNKILEYILFDRFVEIAKHMIITRDDYVSLQHKYIKDVDDPYIYVYSLCPSVQYPLVEADKEIYFPLPHLLIQSVTSSLMYRITEGDDSLRRKIGKCVWEQYLYDIINESGCYEEVFREQKYWKSGAEALSPDVMAKCGKEILFLDSKSTVPSVGIRILEADDYERNIEQVGKYIAKLAKQIWNFKEYNPFKGEASIDKADHWGVVVVQEDSYLRRQFYYENARGHLKMQEDSPEWKWVVDHIKVASLYEVEKISLSGHSVLDACKVCFDLDPYAYPFSGYLKEEFMFVNKKAKEFTEAHYEKVDELLKEMMERVSE